MSRLKPAVVAFVKTPGSSPVKTRLALDIGRERAEQFYELAVRAVESTLTVLREQIDCDVYWAVAEEAAMVNERWQRLPRVPQGTGELSARLSRILSVLHERHSAVVAIGADSPHLTYHVLIEAIERLARHSPQPNHVLGRCHDGGFYLFGSNQPLQRSAWQAVLLGSSDAASSLLEQLKLKEHCVHLLPTIADVDRAHDLPVLCREIKALNDLTPAQADVLRWATAQSRLPNSGQNRQAEHSCSKSPNVHPNENSSAHRWRRDVPPPGGG